MNSPTKITTLTENLNISALAAAKHRMDVVIARRDDSTTLGRVSVVLRATKITRRDGEAYPYRVSIGYARLGRDMIPVREGLRFPVVNGSFIAWAHREAVADIVAEVLAAADATAAVRR